MKKNSMFVPESPNLLTPKKIVETLIEEYFEIARKQIKTLGVRQIRILGSFGRQDAFTESDLDIWIICNQDVIENIESIAKLCQTELDFREKLSKKYKLRNLTRHKATILSKKEADLYQASFHTRVAIPYTLGEQTQLSLERKNHIPGETVKNNETADIIVSLNEFIENWEKAVSYKLSTHIQNKWVRRIAQEVEYITTGIRHISANSLNELLAYKYNNSPEQLLAATANLTKKLQKSVSPSELVNRKLVHHLMWTLEKVRWELIDCYKTPELFEKWRYSLSKKYGFYPREIGNLVLECLNTTNSRARNTEKLGRDLITLTREQKKNNTRLLIDNFHNTLQTWLTEETRLILRNEKSILVSTKTVLLPTIHQEKGKTMSRFGSGNTSRFVDTEYVAYTKLFPKRIIDFQNSSMGMVLTTRDLGGYPIADKISAPMLNEYAHLLLKIHKTKTTKFGRLNSPHLFNNYKDYLVSRVRYAPIPVAMKNRLHLFLITRQKNLRSIQPTLCHMDPGPRNLICDSKGKLKIIDFEHASGCSPVWDIERVLFQLPRKQHKKFIASYYDKLIPNKELILCTRVVMLITFASNLGKRDETLKKLCFNYVKKCLEYNTGKLPLGITIFDC